MVKSVSIFKSILFCFLMMLFSHISIYPTPFSGILVFLIPAFMAYSVYILGIMPSAMLCVAICLFNSVTAYFLPERNLFNTVINSLMPTLPGFVCGLFITKKYSVKDTIISVAFTIVIFPLVALAYAKYVNGYNLTKEITDVFNGIFYDQFDLIKSLHPEFADSFNGNKSEIFSTLTVMIPGTIPAIAIIISIFYSLLIFMISKSLLRRKMIENSFFIQGFDSIYLPKINTTVLLVLIGFLLFETNSLTMMVLINVFLVLLLLFMLQGLSLIEYNLKQRFVNSFVRFMALIGIIIALFVISTIIPILNPIFSLSILGISDSINDYRKINANKDDINEH